MPVLREQIQTSLPIDEAFAFVADFGNAARWDPGVATSRRDGDGPLAVGDRFQLEVRIGGGTSPMEYRITVLEPPRRVVLEGRGSGVEAIDDIRFEPAAGGGTDIAYVADIRLVGLRRLLSPFAGPAFARIARNARDGMTRTLDRLAGDAATGAAR